MLFWTKMVSKALKQIFWHLNKVRFRWVQTSSAKYRHPLNSKLDHRSSSATDLNFQTGPGFGSARFRFELWFRTEPWHHYSRRIDTTSLSHHWETQNIIPSEDIIRPEARDGYNELERSSITSGKSEKNLFAFADLLS